MDDRKITLYPSIVLKTCEEATKLKCPFIMNKQGYPQDCISYKCMAWVEALCESSREDHSGGKGMMFDEARFRGVEAVKGGPGGSYGTWNVPAVGFCKRLWKEFKYE
jgi:hypothetical protein